MDQSWITRILEPLNLNLKDDKMYEVRRHGNKYKVFEIRTKKYIASCINQSDANESPYWTYIREFLTSLLASGSGHYPRWRDSGCGNGEYSG